VRGTRGRGPPTALRSHRLRGAGAETVDCLEIESAPVENEAVHRRGTVSAVAVPEIVAVTRARLGPWARELIVGGSAG